MNGVDLGRILDNYCERVGTDANFWGEPLNAVSNLAFFLAALWVLVLARREGKLDWSVGALTATLFAVGIGSFLFHTFATPWAAALDVIPIQIFILLYFAVVLIRAYEIRWYWSTLIAIAFIPFAAGFGFLARRVFLEGANANYVAALTLLVVNAVILSARGHGLARWLGAGAGLFAVSLSFRIADEPVCSFFPYGTHFLWHVLNGTVTGLLLAGIVHHCVGKPRGT